MKMHTLAAARRSLPALVAIAALALIGCSSDEDADATATDGTPTSTVTADPTLSPLTAIATTEGGGTSIDDLMGPPDAVAASGGVEGALGRGTYCWAETAAGATGGAGICADAIGIITTRQVFAVERGATFDVSGFEPFEPTNGAVSAFAPSDEGGAVGGDLLAWTPEADSTLLSSEIGPAGVTFTADLEPGRYVVSVGLLFAEGDVLYGLVIEVQ
jgi:hypothetical protein